MDYWSDLLRFGENLQKCQKTDEKSIPQKISKIPNSGDFDGPAPDTYSQPTQENCE
jgi:hypothetical protein